MPALRYGQIDTCKHLNRGFLPYDGVLFRAFVQGEGNALLVQTDCKSQTTNAGTLRSHRVSHRLYKLFGQPHQR